MLPGGSGNTPPILAHLGRLGPAAFSPASRVSISELLCVKNVEHRPRQARRREHITFSPRPRPPPPPSPATESDTPPARGICQPPQLDATTSADAPGGQRHELERRRLTSGAEFLTLPRSCLSTPGEAAAAAAMQALAEPGRLARCAGQALLTNCREHIR